MHARPAQTRNTILTASCLALGIWLIPQAATAYVTDSRSHSPASYDTFSPPAKGAAYTDPAFGTEVRRLSDALKSPNNADGGNLTYAMNEYSTISAFNRDGSRLLLQHDSYFALYDRDGKYLRDLPWAVHASSEPRWSRKEAGVLYFVNGNQLKRHDVETGATSVVRTFGEYAQITGKGEADIGFDGDRVVLAGDGRQVFVYDLETDAKGPVLDTGSLGFDSLYMTPAGNVTITWYESGTGRNRGIELYDRNMIFQRQLTRAGGHMDVTRDTDGQEVLVWANSADPTPICDNGVVKVRLSDGKQTCLLTLDWSLAIHVSAPDGDGTAIVSTYAPGDPDPDLSWPAYTNEILRVGLDDSGTERLAHHRSRPFNGYNYMSRATVSRDGQRLLFSSNFGRQMTDGAPSEYSDAYLIGLSASGGGGGSDGGGGGGGGGGNTTPCVPSDTSMCLGDSGRFRVQVAWEDFKGKTGTGKVVPGGSGDSGLFWFFSARNWEMLVKVVDGCAMNRHHWVFAAATTDVAYTITVTDTATGAKKRYANALGSAAPAVTDTTAFASCS